jgi:surfeit locus 1 family protein
MASRGRPSQRGPARRLVALGVVAAVLATLFVRLGVWQLDRLQERRARNEQIRSALALPEISLEGDGLIRRGGRRLAFRRVSARGRYDFSRETVVKGRTWRGAPGVELVAPLRLEGGGEVPVTRGWVPSPDAATIDPARYRQGGPASVRGFLRPATADEVAAAREGRDRLGSVRPTGAELVLERLRDSGSPPFPVARGEPELGSGPHLSYAIQWFSLAAVAVVGCAAYVWTHLRSSSAT